MIFSLLILITIMRAPEIQDSRMHISFNFLVITINIYTTKVNLMNKLSMHKDQKLLRNLSSSNWAQIRLETMLETLSSTTGCGGLAVMRWRLARASDDGVLTGEGERRWERGEKWSGSAARERRRRVLCDPIEGTTVATAIDCQ